MSRLWNKYKQRPIQDTLFVFAMVVLVPDFFGYRFMPDYAIGLTEGVLYGYWYCQFRLPRPDIKE